MARTRIIALTVALLLPLSPAVGLAQPAPSSAISDHDKAVAAFEAARHAIDSGDCPAAVVRLKESLGYEPSVGAHLSLADCAEQSDPLTAWREVEAAAMLAFTNHDERVGAALQRAQVLARRLPTVKLALPFRLLDEPGLEVTLDGVLVDRFLYRDGVIATTPGTHRVEVTVARRRFAQPVVAELEPAPVRVVLEDEHRPAAEDGGAASASGASPIRTFVATPAPDPGTSQRTLGYVTAATSLIGFGVGAVFGAVALEKRTDVTLACGGDASHCTASPAVVDPMRSSASAAATTSTIGFVAGGALLVAGVALVATAPRRSSSLRVVPAVGTRGGGLAAAGTFR